MTINPGPKTTMPTQPASLAFHPGRVAQNAAIATIAMFNTNSLRIFDFEGYASKRCMDALQTLDAGNQAGANQP